MIDHVRDGSGVIHMHKGSEHTGYHTEAFRLLKNAESAAVVRMARNGRGEVIEEQGSVAPLPTGR